MCHPKHTHKLNFHEVARWAKTSCPDKMSWIDIHLLESFYKTFILSLLDEFLWVRMNISLTKQGNLHNVISGSSWYQAQGYAVFSPPQTFGYRIVKLLDGGLAIDECLNAVWLTQTAAAPALPSGVKVKDLVLLGVFESSWRTLQQIPWLAHVFLPFWMLYCTESSCLKFFLFCSVCFLILFVKGCLWHDVLNFCCLSRPGRFWKSDGNPIPA